MRNDCVIVSPLDLRRLAEKAFHEDSFPGAAVAHEEADVEVLGEPVKQLLHPRIAPSTLICLFPGRRASRSLHTIDLSFTHLITRDLVLGEVVGGG